MASISLSRCVRPLGVALLLSILFPADSLGGDRRFWPRRSEWKRAFVAASRDPGTWLPAAGAVVFRVTDLDRDVSDWAVRETPLFGSPRNADRISDRLLDVARVAHLATAFGSTVREREWRPAAVQFTTVQLADLSVGWLKHATDRRRPSGFDSLSFPSGHSTSAFVYANLASMNLEANGFGPRATRGIGLSLQLVAAGTGWARVEAGHHYPSDVLAGAAIGSFVSRFLDEAFLGSRTDARLGVAVSRNSGAVQFRFRF